MPVHLPLQDVIAMLEEGIYDTKKLVEGGWISDLKYEDELIDELKKLTAPDDAENEDKQLRKVGIKKYQKVSPSAFGLNGKKRIAVLRTAGAILGEKREGAEVHIELEALRLLFFEFEGSWHYRSTF